MCSACLSSDQRAWQDQKIEAKVRGDIHLEVPVSGDSQSVAGPTEMLRHGCDEAHLASEAWDFKGL